LRYCVGVCSGRRCYQLSVRVLRVRDVGCPRVVCLCVYRGLIVSGCSVGGVSLIIEFVLWLSRSTSNIGESRGIPLGGEPKYYGHDRRVHDGRVHDGLVATVVSVVCRHDG